MDLEATREGDRVLLTWTPPTETTDKLRIRHPGPTAICRKVEVDLGAALQPSSAEAKPTCENLVESLPPSQLQSINPQPKPAASPLSGATRSSRVTHTVEIPSDLIEQHPDAAAVFYVEPLNSGGRGAGYSNGAAV